MSIFISLFDEKKINTFDRNELIGQDKNNQFPLNSIYTSKDQSFLSLTFSNSGSGSNICFLNLRIHM